ncbi:hypothetical protein SAMN05192553_101106 [Cyclobacterium xiamenense]|uniref:Uncharacterized protein n=1 Tax=Cyclobacterium xiamenense TaxID=1297121 RepID=A0A1H6TFY2_9BACT|nr:hypothetical protein [Cyclobacterium xiamenense]SEI75145.1 hypothetical protein SAMN05192553_101106 [Cyclobacterium xiamenense]
MKNKNTLLTILVTLLLTACSRDEEVIIEALGVDFGYRNGEVILEGDCVDPNQNFAVLVHATMGNFGTLTPREFDVLVNDILYNVTFRGEGTKLIPVELKQGENIARIPGTNHEARLVKNAAPAFERVE